MCLIEQDQAVLAQQAGVHRLHPIRDAVAAEQEPRAHLVDGRTQDGRLRRGTRPVVLQWHPAAQPLRTNGASSQQASRCSRRATSATTPRPASGHREGSHKAAAILCARRSASSTTRQRLMGYAAQFQHSPLGPGIIRRDLLERRAQPRNIAEHHR